MKLNYTFIFLSNKIQSVLLKFSRFYTLVFVIIFVCNLSACSIKMGVKFNSKLVKHIKQGVTTQSQVMKLLGPAESEGLKDGLPLWIYMFAEMSLFGGAVRGTLVTIEFDERGIVESYTYIPY